MLNMAIFILAESALVVAIAHALSHLCGLFWLRMEPRKLRLFWLLHEKLAGSAAIRAVNRPSRSIFVII